MLNLISTDYLSLLQYLKSIELSSVLLFNKHDFAIRPFANYRYHLEILLAGVGTSVLMQLCQNLLISFFKFFILLLLLRQCELSWNELLLLHWHLLLLLVVVNTLHWTTGIGCGWNRWCLLHAFYFLSIFRLSLIYLHFLFSIYFIYSQIKTHYP